ncbi:uncharacterized protein LOC128204328 [Mya arenaria]|uniref:uncharacterized protein LOC128204328 n=1 Tax=Mya arenaria TaxID=6604 RepID=UPI0022E8397C|nr:uncharacterized protein LOC128204328 [Mya arenaria]
MANEAKDTDDWEKYGARPKKRFSQEFQRNESNHPETSSIDHSANSGDKYMLYDNDELTCAFPDKTELSLEDSEKSAIDGYQSHVSYMDNADSAVTNLFHNISEDQANVYVRNKNKNEEYLNVTTLHYSQVHIEKHIRDINDKQDQELNVVARWVTDLNQDNKEKMKRMEQTTHTCLQVLEDSFENNTDAFKQELRVHFQKSVGHFQEQLEETSQRLMQQMRHEIHRQTDDTEFLRTFCADVVELSIERYNSLPFSPIGKEKTVHFFELYVIPSLFRKISLSNRNQEKRKESEKLKTLQEIFEMSSTKTKKVFISGKSGYGKSSFCQFLLLSWCLEQPHTGVDEMDSPLLELKRAAETRQDLTQFSVASYLKDRFEVVFLVNIRSLQRPVCYIEEMITIQVTERLSEVYSEEFFEKVWDLPDEATVENVFKKRAMVASIQEIVLKGYEEAFGGNEDQFKIQFRHVSIRSIGGVK